MRNFVILLCSLASLCKSFNVDLRSTKNFKGTDDSRFGFKIRLHKPRSSGGLIDLMVSAPKESQPSTGPYAGALHFCGDVMSGSADCRETRNQSLLRSISGNARGYTQEGYGMALSVAANGLMYLVCAPNWKDLRFSGSHGYDFLPGRCAVKYFEEGSGKAEDLQPFFNAGANGYIVDGDYYEGVANFGQSSDVTSESIILVGAPGLSLHEGGVYVKDIVSEAESSSGPGEYVNTLNTTAYGYEGYDVTFGRLCDNSFCLAAGAPNLKQSGRVKLYEWQDKEELILLQTIEGENSWSYFGAVLAAVNVDADPYDELLVGAPSYSDATDLARGLDAGKVYVYKRNHNTGKYELEFSVDGSATSHSKFGSAIESLESINLDQFKDVIIGAPGEEEGHGCVYVYIGSSIGMARKFNQRICASQLPGGPQSYHGFGSSFSGSQFPTGSRYPVFAVGSYLSDTVTLFQCRPLAELFGSLEANPNPININADDSTEEVSTMVKLCVNFTIHDSTTRSLDVLKHLEIDTQIADDNVKRAVFVLDNGTMVYRVSHQARGNIGANQCITFKARIKKTMFLRSRFTPIEIVATYKLDESAASKNAPILDINTEHRKSLILTFPQKCGSDNVCKVDLQVQGRLSPTHEGQWNSVVVNHTTEVAAEVTITNAGETSYWTQIQIHISQPFHYLHLKTEDIVKCEQHQPDESSKEVHVLCNSYQPLGKDATIKMTLVFDTQILDLSRKTVNASFFALPMYRTDNPEINLDDNSYLTSLPIEIIAPVSVNGISSPSEIAVTQGRKLDLTVNRDVNMASIVWKPSSDGIQLNHKLQIRNQGPSFLPRTDISLSVPVFLPDGAQLISSLNIELSIDNGMTVRCFNSERSTTTTTEDEQTTAVPTKTPDQSTGSHTTVQTTESTTEETTTKSIFDGKITRRKRSAKSSGQQPVTYALSCSTTPKYCATYKCQLPTSLPKGGNAEVNITLGINQTNIPMPEEFSMFHLLLLTTVNQPDHPLFKRWNTEEQQKAQTNTLTVFHLVQSGGKISLWIIIGSIIGGLLLIVIIALILWKLGFFKREKHYQVEKWKRESIRRSQRRASEKNDSAPNGDGV